MSIFRKHVSKIRFSLKSDENNGYFTWRPVYILIISRSVILRMRNVSVKFYREIKKNAFYVQLRFFENHYVFEVMWTNFVEPDKPQMTIWRMRLACCITKATNTRSEYVILIAFPQEQWSYERASILRYTYVACLLTFRMPQNGRCICSDCTSVVNAHIENTRKNDK
jgi:hypothetical protein